MAELADALDLGSSARKGVGVQVSPSAPNRENIESEKSHAIPVSVIGLSFVRCLDRLLASLSHCGWVDSYSADGWRDPAGHSFRPLPDAGFVPLRRTRRQWKR